MIVDKDSKENAMVMEFFQVPSTDGRMLHLIDAAEQAYVHLPEVIIATFFRDYVLCAVLICWEIIIALFCF